MHGGQEERNQTANKDGDLLIGPNLMRAQTSPVRLRLQDVELRYSCGFSRYVSIMKLRYAR